MPNRIIKESICTSESLSELSWFEQVLFLRLLVTVDDYGRTDARPKILKGKLFPLENVTAEQIAGGLNKLSTSGMVDLYEVGGRPFLELTGWLRHNTPRSNESKYPSPLKKGHVSECKQMQTDTSKCKQMQTDASKCKQMQADVPDIRIRNSYSYSDSDSDSSRNARATRFTPPTLAEVQSYVAERHSPVDPQAFIDFYEAKGWMVGKTPMRDWKAACRNAERWDRWAKSGANQGESSFDCDEFFEAAVRKATRG